MRPVRMGDYDVVKEVLSSGENAVWFGGVAMQPGKPQGFGLIGDDRTAIFTLPGNPVSAYVSFQAFVLPAIRKMREKTHTAESADRTDDDTTQD